MDGVQGPANISQHFASKIQLTLNSENSDSRDALFHSINSSLTSSDLTHLSISYDCVSEAFRHIKRGKSDNLASDHFISAAPAISSFLASLFTAILRHGHLPKSLQDCVLVPIPKGKKDPSLSENYRPIALAPTVSKLLEWALLITFSGHFATSDLQFGFKAGFSTTLCTGVLKNVASHYMSENTPVYACFLDASKTFDLVNHERLFSKLLNNGFPMPLVRLLISWYKEQRMSVRWDSHVSDSFPTTNGVRQGGVLSPILFSLYIDDLLVKLSNLGVGCHWEGFFAGALCYADDLVLLAPSPAALRILLRCCESFAASHNLVFNASKTQLIRFSTKPSTLSPAKIFFCNQLLCFSDSVCHLGHTLKFNLSDDDDVLIRSRDLVKKANHLLVSFAGVGPGILTRLFQCFCLSLYGAALWTLNCPAIKSLEISYNKILRRIWSLPARSHTTIVHHVARLPSLFNLIRSRSLSLLRTANLCSSHLVWSLFHQSSLCCYTFCGFNSLFGQRYLKHCNQQYAECADIIRSFRLKGQSNSDVEHVIRTILVISFLS